MISGALELHENLVWKQEYKVFAFIAKFHPLRRRIIETHLSKLLWKDLIEAKDTKYGQVFQKQDKGKIIYALVLDMPLADIQPKHLTRHLDGLEVNDSDKILFIIKKKDKSKHFKLNYDNIIDGLADSKKRIILCKI